MFHLLIFLALTAYLTALFIQIVREDNVSGKIRNALIIKGFMVVGIAILLLALQTTGYYLLAGNTTAPLNALPYMFYLGYLQHITIAAVAAILLWKAGSWPAGDAKMFILAALAIPVIIPSAAYFPNLLFLSLLINIFIPASLIFILQAAIALPMRILKDAQGNCLTAGRFATTKLKETLRDTANNPAAAVPFLVITMIFGTVRFFRTNYPGLLPVSESAFFALMLLAWPVLAALLKLIPAPAFQYHFPPAAQAAASALSKLNWKWPLVSGIACISLCLLHPLGRLICLNSAYGLTRSIPFMLLHAALRALVDKDTLITLDRHALRQGTILTDNYLKKIHLAAPDYYLKELNKTYPDGLTAEQAEELKLLISQDATTEAALSKISARSGKPFASWIAGGTLITIALNGETVVNLCKYLISLLKR